MKSSKIKYQIIGGYGLWQHYKSEGTILEVIIEGVDQGYVQINEVQSKIDGGIATLDLRILKDGVYEPALVYDAGVIRLEAIRKSEGSLAPLKTSDSTVRRLLKRVYEAESKVTVLEEKVAAIEEKIRTDVLF